MGPSIRPLFDVYDALFPLSYTNESIHNISSKTLVIQQYTLSQDNQHGYLLGTLVLVL